MTWGHPLPDGSLVWVSSGSYGHHPRGMHNPECRQLGIIESYVRDYNPCDSFYFVVVGERLTTRERGSVWPVV